MWVLEIFKEVFREVILNTCSPQLEGFLEHKAKLWWVVRLNEEVHNSFPVTGVQAVVQQEPESWAGVSLQYPAFAEL